MTCGTSSLVAGSTSSPPSTRTPSRRPGSWSRRTRRRRLFAAGTLALGSFALWARRLGLGLVDLGLGLHRHLGVTLGVEVRLAVDVGLSLKPGVWHAAHSPGAAAPSSRPWQRKHAVIDMKSACGWLGSPVCGSVSVSSKSSTCATRLWHTGQAALTSACGAWSILMPSLGVTFRVSRLWHCVHCVDAIVSDTSLSPLSGSSKLSRDGQVELAERLGLVQDEDDRVRAHRHVARHARDLRVGRALVGDDRVVLDLVAALGAEPATSKSPPRRRS